MQKRGGGHHTSSNLTGISCYQVRHLRMMWNISCLVEWQATVGHIRAKEALEGRATSGRNSKTSNSGWQTPMLSLIDVHNRIKMPVAGARQIFGSKVHTSSSPTSSGVVQEELLYFIQIYFSIGNGWLDTFPEIFNKFVIAGSFRVSHYPQRYFPSFLPLLQPFVLCLRLITTGIPAPASGFGVQIVTDEFETHPIGQCQLPFFLLYYIARADHVGWRICGYDHQP